MPRIGGNARLRLSFVAAAASPPQPAVFRSRVSRGIEVGLDGPVGVEGDLQDPALDILLGQESEGVRKQSRLNVEAHQPMRHRDADQAGVVLLTLDQRGEVPPVIRQQHVSVRDRTPHQRPVRPRPQPEPSYVRRLGIAPLSGKRRQGGAQAFVDQELHRAGGSASKAVSPETTGSRERQKGALRGRPRRG